MKRLRVAEHSNGAKSVQEMESELQVHKEPDCDNNFPSSNQNNGKRVTFKGEANMGEGLMLDTHHFLWLAWVRLSNDCCGP